MTSFSRKLRGGTHQSRLLFGKPLLKVLDEFLELNHPFAVD
jgi:hypothetical protein